MRKREDTSNRMLLRAFAVCAFAVVACVVLIVVVWSKLSDTNTRQSHDEYSTCKIQSISLTAKPYLVDSLNGIHQLLTLPPSRAQRQMQASIPPKLLKHELQLVATLNKNLATYVRIERSIPNSHSC